MDTLRTVKTLTLAVVGTTCLTLLSHSQVQAANFSTTYNEQSGTRTDAGGLLNTAGVANTSPGGTPLDFIRGTLWGGVDLYQIYLTGNPFLATTENPLTNYDVDSQLFLFNGNGVGLFANDDTPANDPRNHDQFGSKRSTIRLSNGITPGLYYLGIADFGFNPIDATGQFIFGNSPLQDALVAASNPSPLTGWQSSSAQSSTKSNSYGIRLLGAQFVPATDPIFNNPGSGSGGSNGPNTGNPNNPGTTPGGGSGGSGGDPGTTPGGGSGGSGGGDPGTTPGGGSGGSGGGDPGTTPGGGPGGNGSVTVPEPSSVLGLIALAAIGFGTLRKRMS